MNDKAIWLSLVLYSNRVVKAVAHPDEESAIEYLYEYMALNMIYMAEFWEFFDAENYGKFALDNDSATGLIRYIEDGTGGFYLFNR